MPKRSASDVCVAPVAVRARTCALDYVASAPTSALKRPWPAETADRKRVAHLPEATKLEFSLDDVRAIVAQALAKREAELRLEFDSTLQALRHQQYHAFAAAESAGAPMNYLS